MKSLLVAIPLSVTILGVQQLGPKGQPMHAAATETYEHLATAIIEIRATEDNLVKGILMHHHAQAHHHLMAADGPDAAQHLEAAAAEVANIANEGSKPVQAIRQRLLQAGHHHHTDADTKEDYMFIDSKEKAALLALSGKIGKAAAAGSKADGDALAGELEKLFNSAIESD